MWLERLQAVTRGETWSVKHDSDVAVSDELLSQLVTQGFERSVCFILLHMEETTPEIAHPCLSHGQA
jgi:hypothetical protein